MKAKYLILSILLLVGLGVAGQENTTLFFMPTPQANFVNPAVRNDCKLTIGLPIISSLHLNYGNSGFSYNRLFKKDGDSYVLNPTIGFSGVGRSNYISTEFHANLFHLGLWYEKNYFTFTVNEKADFFAVWPGEIFAMVAKGNSAYEGKTVDLSRNSMSFNYRREYAFGIARQPYSYFVWGARAKFLFGKMNMTARNNKLSVYTDPITNEVTVRSTYNLDLSMGMKVNTNSDKSVQSYSTDLSPLEFVLNRKNWGFATDLGFIDYYSDEITVAGSILDLGFIRWKTDVYHEYQDVTYNYTGALNDTLSRTNYISELTNVITNTFTLKAEPKSSYITFLQPLVYLGGTYNFSPTFNTGLVSFNRITRKRLTSGLTLSANRTFSSSTVLSLSYSYINRSFNNLGLGVRFGRSPVQFYFVSDNILGFIRPYDTRTINLRFGLQIVLGCTEKGKLKNECGCIWAKEPMRKKKK